ncbi:MAG: signal peptide peptidase SppA [Bacteroidetes bacterium]|mgnify:CR=1 FL=1|nr:signal peptide peptidase SppA [Bacteroidota bacterium]MCB8929685.1 signal peptide peptidase SppA [Bacteroidia bacterium]MCE7955836.1 signal peptide peptidase SppA [Bacteroidetes bacterium CHB6]MCB0848187.1 signal peptide peptidase SppA [Bacteroidota bacterium]MCC7513630.1 signal peptide peptidase SppA [Bacteroidia bacterium]
MKQFFKYLLASLTALFLFCIIVFFIFGALLGSAFQKEVATVKSNSVLKIEFSQPLDERTDNNPFKNLNLASLKPSNQPGLNDITKCLENAAADANIKGVLLNLNYLEGGYASIRELRNALIEFKKSKKYVIAYSEGYSTKAYYLASVADKVYLHPQGAVDFRGLFTQLVFFKGALEKLEIEPEIIRHGKFKSAIEPFILDKMSPENREQTSTYVNAIWETLCSEIAESRNISRADLENIADSLTAENANDALKLRLVDQLTYQDELDKIIATRNGDEKDKINFVSLVKYKDVPAPKSDKKFTQDRIAVIYATGEIVSGKGERGQMGSDNIAAAIKKAREDSKVKAIVLRVNSPGGSALASDVIWRETKLAKEAKPFIVSMGDVAASGGYYISCLADTIVAQPNTITGSIGVFGLLMNAQKLLTNKLGLTFDTYKTGPYADMGLPTRALTPMEREKIQKGVEEVYDTFISHVAEGRHITKADVDSIGQGRVWSAVDAKKIGLVDMFGGLDDAVKLAAKKAGVDNYRIKELPEQKEPLQEFLEELKGESVSVMLPDYMKESLNTMRYIQHISQKDRIQMRLPFGIVTD